MSAGAVGGPVPGAGRVRLILLLVVIGAGWGLTEPLSKIAVDGGYQPLGLIFWQLVIASVALGLVCLLRGRLPRITPRRLGLWAVIALVGTILPNGVSYRALAHLPSGVMSILISMVPMFAFPIALALGNDRFSLTRIAGLCLGLGGVVLIVGPEASLPDPAMAAFIPLALLAPFFYAVEGNLVSRWGTSGMDPVQTLFGASILGMVLVLPATLASGQWIDPRPPWGAADMALIASSLIHAVIYCGYVWMVGRAGSVFAAQVAYLVTSFGMLWAMLILGEAYSGYVWTALALMLSGLALVQPRPALPPVPRPVAGAPCDETRAT